MIVEKLPEYKRNKKLFNKVCKRIAEIVHDTENMDFIRLNGFCDIMPNDKKAYGMYFKHKELLKEGKITQEAYDKYQSVVIKVLKDANIPLDSGSDPQQ